METTRFGDDIKVIAGKFVGSTKLHVRRVSVEEAAGATRPPQLAEVALQSLTA